MSGGEAGGGDGDGGNRPRRPPTIHGLERFSFVGKGGRASVWRAWESAFNRLVAVKILLQYDDDRSLSRFNRECLAVGSLDHPNIVTVHRTGLTDDTGFPFLQMEYLPKGSLADAIRKSGPMGWREGVPMGVKLAGALATAHERGVLHRDIKPENVLRTSLDEPKLADFGIARVLGESLSNTTVYDLTPDYAPPEMARLWTDDVAPDESSPSFLGDVYSLGATLFAVLHGAPPFTRPGDHPIAILHRIPIEPVPDLRPFGVPGEVCEVIDRAMAKDPRDRQVSAHEFGEQLRRAEARLGASQTPLPFIAPKPASPEFVEPDTRRVVVVPPATPPEPPLAPPPQPSTRPSPPAPPSPAAPPSGQPPRSPARPATRPSASPALKAAILLVALAVVGLSARSIRNGIVGRSSPTSTTAAAGPGSGGPTTSTTSTTATTVPGPRTLPASGPVTAGRYTTANFVPKTTFSLVGDGWNVNDGASAERVELTRKDTTETITLMRVQRVYNSQQRLATKDDALNSVMDVRDIPKGLADWLATHPQHRDATSTDATIGGIAGKRVVEQFAGYDYEGCGTPENKCVPLFQLATPDGGTFAYAKVPIERIRFDVVSVQGITVVVASSALTGEFDGFVRDRPLSVEQFEPNDRVSALRVRSTPNPARQNEGVTLSAEVTGPCRAGKVVFSEIPFPDQKKELGKADVVGGKATLPDPVTFPLPGQDRIVAEYVGSDCARGISAPLVQRVT